METKEMLPQTGIGSLIEGLQNPKKMEEGSWQELYRWYCAQEDWSEKVHDLARISRYRRPEDNLTLQTARKLYGDWAPSISRLEKAWNGLRLQRSSRNSLRRKAWMRVS